MNQNKCIASVILVVLVSSFFLGCGDGGEEEDRQAQLKVALEIAEDLDRQAQVRAEEAAAQVRAEEAAAQARAEEEAAAKKAAEAPSALLWSTLDRKDRNAWIEMIENPYAKPDFGPNSSIGRAWSRSMIDPEGEWDDIDNDYRKALISSHEQYLTAKVAEEEASKREAVFQERIGEVNRLFPEDSSAIIDIARYVNNIEEFEDSPAQVLAELLFGMRGAKEYYSENPPEERGAVWFEISYSTSRSRKQKSLTKSMFNYCLKFIEQTVENSSYKKQIEATAQLVALCSKKSEVSDIELAIDQGALVNISTLGETLLVIAMKNQNDAEVVFKLLNSGSFINVTDLGGSTPMMHAIRLGYSKEVISRMLSLGSIVKSRNLEDNFPLMMAVQSNNRKIVSLLLQSYKCGNPQCDFYSEDFFDLAIPDWSQERVCPQCDEPARKNQIMLSGGEIKRVSLEGREGQAVDIGINSTVGDLTNRGRRVWSNSERPWGKTPLIEAVTNSDVDSDMVSLLIKAGSDVNHLWHVGVEDSLALLPSQAAIMSGASLEKVIHLMNSGSDFLTLLLEYSKKSRGFVPFATPLMMACKHQSAEVVSELLKHLKTDGNLSNTIEIEDANGMTAFCYAAKFNESPEIISELIKYGAEINKYSKVVDKIYTAYDYGYYASIEDFLTPLMLAAKSNNAEVVKRLIEKGSDVHSMTRQGKTALMFAAHYNANDSVCSELINSGAKVNGTNPVVGLTPLMYASIHNDNPDVISTLVEAGARIGQRATEIDLSAINRNAGYEQGTHAPTGKSKQYQMYFEIIQSKFDHSRNGMTISKQPVKGMTPLMFASRWNQNPEIAKRLLQHGSDIHAVDKGFSPIHHAAQHNMFPEVIKVLIDAGANINSRSDERGNVPILLAASLNRSPAVCSALIDAGADITATFDTRRRTARGSSGDVLTLLDLMTRNPDISGSPLWNKIRDLTLAEEAR